MVIGVPLSALSALSAGLWVWCRWIVGSCRGYWPGIVVWCGLLVGGVVLMDGLCGNAAHMGWFVNDVDMGCLS